MSAEVEGGRKGKGEKGKQEGRGERAGGTVPVLQKTRRTRNREASKPRPRHYRNVLSVSSLK